MQEYDKNKVLDYQRDINRTSQIMGAPKWEKKNLLTEKKGQNLRTDGHGLWDRRYIKCSGEWIF